MSYYHVSIAKKSGTTRWAFSFDLSKERVMQEIISPLAKWEPFICGDSPIDPTDIDYIRINETDETANQIIRRTRLKRIFSEFFGSFSESEWGKCTEEWYVTHAGKDVTEQFLKGIDVSKKILKLSVMKKPVFIIHGTETESAKELKEILGELGISSIVLQEEASKGKTVIEKLEEYADKVGYVFVVLTPDDMGASVSDIVKFQQEYPEKGLLSGVIKARPRQNVIFEFGYFAGKLGRNRVCYMKKGNPEHPSDIEGIVYIPFQKSLKKVKDKIIKELREAGYEIKV
jgi:predicted nucleotide-binding protein